MTMKNQTGCCQCGRVSYTLLDDALMLYVCHCLGCQKQSSSAFAMSLRMRREDVEFRESSLTFWETQADSGAPKVCAFCRICGNRIYHAGGHDSDTINIKPGTLDDTSWLDPKAHIWTSRAQSWMIMNKGLPACDEQPEDMYDFVLGEKAGEQNDQP